MPQKKVTPRGALPRIGVGGVVASIIDHHLQILKENIPSYTNLIDLQTSNNIDLRILIGGFNIHKELCIYLSRHKMIANT